jgi:hypothetical protein
MPDRPGPVSGQPGNLPKTVSISRKTSDALIGRRGDRGYAPDTLEVT